MSNTDTINLNLNDYFSLPLKQAKALFGKLVLDPRPLEPGEMVCQKCNGVGKCGCDGGDCPECDGKGKFDHYCDCEFCNQTYEDCDKCNGTGDCPKCHGAYECSFCNDGRVGDDMYYALANPAPSAVLMFGDKEK